MDLKEEDQRCIDANTVSRLLGCVNCEPLNYTFVPVIMVVVFGLENVLQLRPGYHLHLTRLNTFFVYNTSEVSPKLSNMRNTTYRCVRVVCFQKQP